MAFSQTDASRPQQPLHGAEAAAKVLGQLPRRRPGTVAVDECLYISFPETFSKRRLLFPLVAQLGDVC